jgi:hypothetical protein
MTESLYFVPITFMLSLAVIIASAGDKLIFFNGSVICVFNAVQNAVLHVKLA